MISTKTPRQDKKQSVKHLRTTDARAVVQLATAATHNVTRIVEGVHQSIWSTLGAPAGKTKEQTRGVTGFVFKSIHGITQLLGTAADQALTRIESLLPTDVIESDNSPQREAVLAALNGVMGDRLEESKNPFATQMALHYQGEILDAHSMTKITSHSSKVVVLIHGLCMNDLQWTTLYSDALTAHGYTPIFLRYNTGLHISQNGALLSQQLETLVQNWPVTLSDLTLLTHSLGGLVSRSAVAQAQHQNSNWTHALKRLIFLGTPHHGAPLERAGSWVDVVLGATPYSAPFKKLGQLRSAGITDLRYGFLTEQDWQGHDRFRRRPDRRTPTPLPIGVACYAIAASMASKRSPLADRLIGDGLVPLKSALGQHDDKALDLNIPKSHQQILYKTNHMALLNSPEVMQILLQWMNTARE